MSFQIPSFIDYIIAVDYYSQIHPALQQIPAHSTLEHFACDWLALDWDISCGQLTSPNMWRYIPIES